MKNQIIFGGITALLVVATGISGATLVSADSSSSSHSAKTAKADGRIRTHAKLNQAERDGTITSAQKTAFETELKTLKKERHTDLTKSSTKAQRQAERTKLTGELKSWASSSNFPLAKIFPKLAS